MLLIMLLAHLVGDYLLQWDSLALWKSQEAKGAFVHGLIVLAVTVLCAILYDPTWWPWALFIGITHIIVDVGQQWLKEKDSLASPKLSPLARYLMDQVIHISIIVIVLWISGHLTTSFMPILNIFHNERILTIILGYVFVTLPAWILIEFLVYGLINGAPPNFQEGMNKYVGSIERGLITTSILLGSPILIVAFTLPRLLYELPQVAQIRLKLYFAEFFTSSTIAIFTGLFLSQIWAMG